MPLNAWNATADINAVINFVNQQASGGAPIAPEDFYSLQLLDTIRLDAEHYVYYQQADTMPIQNKADKLVLRRWAALQAHTVPLTEGVPPVSDKGSVKKYEMEAYQYGRYMEFTDKVDFKVVDPVVAHYTKEYSLVAMETLDLLAREALMTVAQKYYASAGETPVTAATGLTVQSIPKMNELRKIILCMKKALIKPRSNGKYLVIGTPEFYFDLFSDPLVQSWMTINQSTGNMYDKVSQPLPDMFDMSFIETMAAPVSGEFYDAEGALQMRTINSSGTLGTVAGSTGYVEAESAYVNDPTTGKPASYIPNRKEWNLGSGNSEFKMHHIRILGKEALVRTGLSGQDSARMYTKALGSAGVLDPIDQRQSIGFKINSVGFGSTRPEAVWDYVCVPTMANI